MTPHSYVVCDMVYGTSFMVDLVLKAGPLTPWDPIPLRSLGSGPTSSARVPVKFLFRCRIRTLYDPYIYIYIYIYVYVGTYTQICIYIYIENTPV